MRNSVNHLFEKKWQPAKGRANQKKKIEKTCANHWKHQKKKEKKTRGKARKKPPGKTQEKTREKTREKNTRKKHEKKTRTYRARENPGKNPPTPLWRWRRAYWGANSHTKCSITFVNIAVAISALAGGGKNGFAPRPGIGGVCEIFRRFLGVWA